MIKKYINPLNDLITNEKIELIFERKENNDNSIKKYLNFYFSFLFISFIYKYINNISLNDYIQLLIFSIIVLSITIVFDYNKINTKKNKFTKSYIIITNNNFILYSDYNIRIISWKEVKDISYNGDPKGTIFIKLKTTKIGPGYKGGDTYIPDIFEINGIFNLNEIYNLCLKKLKKIENII